ncbi:foldase [Ornithinibacillus gellani]|uniref:peptidylprolyl isomerase n=1 Tax=Ornithinibacillus gellani TaxID=2293253 RepID=UPI000F47FC6C|nr:peptidylprolyl isomerase [Ornithinibacillus gellani]TQS76600.1 foldase [Ornithinibacillus gellani]
MKKLVIAMTVASGLLVLGACSSDKGDSEAVVETKAGNVTKEEFYNVLKDRYGEAVLKELTTIKVLSDKYEVSDKEIDAEVKNFKDQLGENFEMWLMQNGIKDEDALREALELSLLQEKAASEDMDISEDEIKQRYENMKVEIEAEHILVEDEETAKEVKEKVDKGEDFAKLAKKYSKDEGTAEDGGKLGFFSVGKMLPEFEEAAYGMKVGDISEPVKTQYGFHIIKVTDRRDVEEDIGSFEDNKDQIRRQIANEKLDVAKAQEKIDKMMKDAKIDVKIKEYKDIFKEEEEADKEADEDTKG